MINNRFRMTWPPAGVTIDPDFERVRRTWHLCACLCVCLSRCVSVFHALKCVPLPCIYRESLVNLCLQQELLAHLCAAFHFSSTNCASLQKSDGSACALHE